MPGARFFSCRWCLTYLSCLTISKGVIRGTTPPHFSFRSSHRSRRVVNSRLDFGQPRWHNHYHWKEESTRRHLFFRRTETTFAARRRPVNNETLERLQSRELVLPFFIEFEEDANGDFFPADDRIYVRCMKIEDIQKVMPMCIEEFGQGPSMSLLDFPLNDLRKVSNWWDRVYFEPSVYLSLRSKINANLPSGSAAKDPSVMVLCRQSETSNTGEDIIGMVEVSLQAPEADKNPPPFPFPLWYKEFYCRLTGSRLQGWVTNLLIDPRYRGNGYSKILMSATEGIAKSWGCHYIYLHADADYRSGKTAQALYKRLGYEVVTDRGPEYAWMMGDVTDSNPFSSIRIIEGVPLLCFYKRLQM